LPLEIVKCVCELLCAKGYQIGPVDVGSIVNKITSYEIFSPFGREKKWYSPSRVEKVSSKRYQVIFQGSIGVSYSVNEIIVVRPKLVNYR
jgi:hypothetical protein